jgi:hypothetical protein
MRAHAAAAASTTLAAGALATLAACGGGTSTGIPSGFDARDFLLGCPASPGPPMSRAFIGPDVSLTVLCGGKARAAIASVDEAGDGETRWSASLGGDHAFSLERSSFVSCQGTGPQVAFVSYAPPATATPGTTFAAVVTVHAEDGSFPDGAVALHGEVAAPRLSASRADVDFGDLAPGDMAAYALDFTVEDGSTVDVVRDPFMESPFYLTLLNPDAGQTAAPPISHWRVAFQSRVPGAYAASVAFHAQLSGTFSLPPPCLWTQTVTMHARVLGDGGTSDGGDGGTSDGGDGGTSDGGDGGPSDADDGGATVAP